jgi:hypothetical protein
MSLNVAQYLAPLNSAQVLVGYTQGVKQGTGVTIATDGTISLNPAGAATLGFLTSSTAPAPIYNWTLAGGSPGSILTNDGAGNLTWDTNYVQTFPLGQAFPHTGAAAIPAGITAGRPAATKGFLRYNTDFERLEFFNGTAWLPVSPASGGVFSFVSPGSPSPVANAAGDLWFDTVVNQESVWNGTSWVPTSPLANAVTPGRVKIGTNIQIAVDGTISILPTTGVPGGVSNIGVTTVTDNVTSLSVDSALSANQGRLLQDQINALLISSNLTLAGLIAGNGLMTYVTPEGALQGFVSGSPLPGPSVTNSEYFVIVESAGGFTPPGGLFTTVTQGDWFLSTGIVWQFLNVGYDPPYATDTVPGIIEIATDAETQAGTDATRAVTPASLSSRTATETRSGIAEIATQAEANAGVDDVTIISPLKLATYLTTVGIPAPNVSLTPAINGWTNVQQALEDAVYDITSAGSTILTTETPTGQFNLEVAQATEALLGGAQIATQAETDNGLLDDVVITPLKLGARVASETLTGIAAIATQAEVNGLINDTDFVTPLKIGGLLSSGSIDANDLLLAPAINGNLNVQSALQDAVYDITSTGLTIVPTETATGKFNLEVAQATEALLGGAQIATQAETNNGLLDDVVITPLKLGARVASETLTGIAAIATQAEVNALTNDTEIVTPLKLGTLFSSGSIDANDILLNPSINGNPDVQTALQDAVYDITSTGLTVTLTTTATGKFNLEVTQATETQLGGAEIATNAETQALASDSVIVTPLKLGNLFSSGSIDANDILLSPSINGNTNVQAALQDAVYDLNSANNSITITETATGINDVIVAQATETLVAGAEIATQIETETGTDDTRIVTPLKLRTAAVYKSDFNAKGDLLSATANDTPTLLPVGTAGQVLTVDLTTPTGLTWATQSAPAAAAFYNLDDVSASFDGIATSFPLAISGIPYTPAPISNIMVFVGGVAQVPGAGNAYIIVGSNISFTSAPPAGATFYATTVK